MLKATHSIDGSTPIVVAQSNYNELGQPIEKNLHSTDGINYKQSVDFSYNIRGWMTGINQSNIASVAGGDVVADYFGMDLAYNNPFSGLSAAASYNGNISSIKWSNGSSKQQAYAFDYDAQNRLLNAHHFDNDSVTWARHWRAYSEMGISYDLNGNILKLKRYGYQGMVMDNLTYGYQGNQLKYVHDAGSVTAGFVNGNTGTDDYTYDNAVLGNGNMTADKNKGITAVNYNFLNLPQQVNKGGTDYVVYTYDASGRKWAQQVFGTNPKTTDYLGELIYEGGNLQAIQMGEGRVLPDGAGWEYQYHLKDHLGNVHVTFTSKTQTTNTVTAGFETANQTTEATKFKNYPSASHINVVASNANSGSNSLYLNGAASGQVGVAKDYSVMPGDVVQIQAYAKYLTPTGTGSNLANFAPALLAAFNLGAPALGETGTASSAVQSWGQIEAGGYGNGSTNNATPKVFVTILLFDRNYNFLDVAYQQLGSSGAQMSASYTVREPGYAYLYVSNEHATQVDVYFDDIVMSHTPGQIVSATDYMPFGLAFRAGERQGAIEQKMLYSSKELQDELALNWYDFGARMYDASIGRWMAVDPLAEKARRWSPYTYANNNPIRFIDPDGMQTKDEVLDSDDPEGGGDENKPAYQRIKNHLREGREYSGVKAGGGDCPSCPAGSEYDDYRKANSAFGYDSESGIVYNDPGVDIVIRPGSDDSAPSVEVNITFGVQAGFEIGGLVEADVTVVNAELLTNDPDKMNDGKVSVENSIGFSFLDILGFGFGQEQKIGKRVDEYTSSQYQSVTSTTLVGIKDEKKSGVSKVEKSSSHTIFSFKCLFGIEIKSGTK